MKTKHQQNWTIHAAAGNSNDKTFASILPILYIFFALTWPWERCHHDDEVVFFILSPAKVNCSWWMPGESCVSTCNRASDKQKSRYQCVNYWNNFLNLSAERDALLLVGSRISAYPKSVGRKRAISAWEGNPKQAATTTQIIEVIAAIIQPGSAKINY